MKFRCMAFLDRSHSSGKDIQPLMPDDVFLTSILLPYLSRLVPGDGWWISSPLVPVFLLFLWCMQVLLFTPHWQNYRLTNITFVNLTPFTTPPPPPNIISSPDTSNIINPPLNLRLLVLSFAHLNIRGLLPETDFTQVLLSETAPDFFTLTETRAQCQCANEDITVAGCKSFRCDRKSKGGVLIYV